MTNTDLAEAIQELRNDNRTLRDEVRAIRQALDELTGVKKFIVWMVATLMGIGLILVSWVKHK